MLVCPSRPITSECADDRSHRMLYSNINYGGKPNWCVAANLPLVFNHFAWIFNGRFLMPEALEGILEYCREATVFYDVKPGYLGAYVNEGLTRYCGALLYVSFYTCTDARHTRQ